MKEKIQSLSKFEKLRLAGMIIKAVTGVVGTSMILEQANPYLTLSCMAIGAGSNELVSFLKDREHKTYITKDDGEEEKNQA